MSDATLLCCRFATMAETNLFIIAGCDGAGKTTASFTIPPEIIDCKEFVNADEIAKGLSPFQPEKVAFEAGQKTADELLTIFDDLKFDKLKRFYDHS